MNCRHCGAEPYTDGTYIHTPTYRKGDCYWRTMGGEEVCPKNPEDLTYDLYVGTGGVE